MEATAPFISYSTKTNKNKLKDWNTTFKLQKWQNVSLFMIKKCVLFPTSCAGLRLWCLDYMCASFLHVLNKAHYRNITEISHVIMWLRSEQFVITWKTASHVTSHTQYMWKKLTRDDESVVWDSHVWKSTLCVKSRVKIKPLALLWKNNTSNNNVKSNTCTTYETPTTCGKLTRGKKLIVQQSHVWKVWWKLNF